MTYLHIIGIAVGLSMDALAVSITSGFLIKNLKIHHAFRIAFFFGLFQALMPVLGWLGGFYLLAFIKHIDHWIAFFLLAFIGIKMIIESRALNKKCSSNNCLHFPTLIVLSIATSIDAFAVGISFGVFNMPLLIPIIIIGCITFSLCLLGVFVGNKFGSLFESKIELIGGIILIFIGLKILFDHLIKG